MARAYGSSATLLLKRETTYGQVAASDYIRIPFNRCTLGSEQGLIDDPVLGQGATPTRPCRTPSWTRARSSCPSIRATSVSG